MNNHNEWKIRLALARLVLRSDVQQLRLSLEELSVGSVCLSSTGRIEAIDAWTEQSLQFSPGELVQSHITNIFDDHAFDLLEIIRNKTPGYLGRVALRTRSGERLMAELVLALSLEPHRYFFTIIYAASAA